MSQIATRASITQTQKVMRVAPMLATQGCPNGTCAAGPWTVQLLSAQNSLWRVSSASEGSYLVAGVTPACPFCGTSLAATAA